MVSFMVLVVLMMLLSTGLLVEGEGVGERALVSLILVSSQTTSSQNSIRGQQGKQGNLHQSHLVKLGLQVFKHEHCQAQTEAPLLAPLLYSLTWQTNANIFLQIFVDASFLGKTPCCEVGGVGQGVQWMISETGAIPSFTAASSGPRDIMCQFLNQTQNSKALQIYTPTPVPLLLSPKFDHLFSGGFPGAQYAL